MKIFSFLFLFSFCFSFTAKSQMNREEQFFFFFLQRKKNQNGEKCRGGSLEIDRDWALLAQAFSKERGKGPELVF